MMSICVNEIYDSVQYTYFNKYQIICLDVPSEEMKRHSSCFQKNKEYEEVRVTMSVKMKVNVSDDGRVDGCFHMMMVKLKAIFARFFPSFLLLFTTRDISL